MLIFLEGEDEDEDDEEEAEDIMSAVDDAVAVAEVMVELGVGGVFFVLLPVAASHEIRTRPLLSSRPTLPPPPVDAAAASWKKEFIPPAAVLFLVLVVVVAVLFANDGIAAADFVLLRKLMLLLLVQLKLKLKQLDKLPKAEQTGGKNRKR